MGGFLLGFRRRDMREVPLSQRFGVEWLGTMVGCAGSSCSIVHYPWSEVVCIYGCGDPLSRRGAWSTLARSKRNIWCSFGRWHRICKRSRGPPREHCFFRGDCDLGLRRCFIETSISIDGVRCYTFYV